MVLREVGRGFLRIGLGLLHLRGWLVLLDVGLRPFCTRLYDWLRWLVWHSIDILVEVDVIQRSVVYAQGVGLDAGEQHESPLIGNADVSNSLGRDTQAVEQLIVLNVPDFEVVLTHCEDVLSVELAEGKMRDALRVCTSLSDALHGLQVPVLYRSIR